MQRHSRHRVLGLDAGATHTVVSGRCEDTHVRKIGPGTNLQRDGLDACVSRLAGVAIDVLSDLPPTDRLYVCAGVSGAGRAEDQNRLRTCLADRLVTSAWKVTVEVVHDGILALESALPQGRSGLVAVVGTGSLVLARTEEGEILRAGGWGPQIDDAGSGTALGRAALAAIASDFDGGEPTILRMRLAEQYGLDSPDDLIRLVYESNVDPAALAPMVIETADVPDWAATRILQQEANGLARRAAWLAARAEEAGTMRREAALVGGLTQSRHYREVIAEAFLRHLPGWRMLRPDRTPEEAALARAQRLAAA